MKSKQTLGSGGRKEGQEKAEWKLKNYQAENHNDPYRIGRV